MTMFDMIKSFFPKSALDRNNDMQVLWWTKACGDLEMPIVTLALDQIFNNEKFEPTLAVIKEYYTKIVEEQLTGAEEGWGKVKQAIRNFGYARPQEALESLPAEVQEAVQAMGGWQSVCEIPSESEGTARAQFRDCLRIVVSRKKTLLQTNKSVVAQIENIRSCEPQNRLQIGCSVNTEQIIERETKTHTDDFTSIDDVMGNLRKQIADRKKSGRYA